MVWLYRVLLRHTDLLTAKSFGGSMLLSNLVAHIIRCRFCDTEAILYSLRWPWVWVACRKGGDRFPLAGNRQGTFRVRVICNQASLVQMHQDINCNIYISDTFMKHQLGICWSRTTLIVLKFLIWVKVNHIRILNVKIVCSWNRQIDSIQAK